jgi:chromosome segregation ATPase
MSDVLEGAAETIASVFVVRDLGLSKVQEMAGALAAAEDKARAAGVRVSNEAAVVHDCLTALRQRLATDPLAVPVDEINQASAGVDRLGQEIDQAVAEVTGVEAALEHIQTDLQRSRANLAQARHDCADAEAKIAMPAGLPSAAAIDDLARRLAELQSNLDNAYRQFVAGDRQAAARLAGAIGPVATQVRGSTEGLARCTAAPLARRRELRGRLDAYRAKAHSLGRAEDPVVADLYQRAQEILYTAPCELDEAQRRLAAYQAYILARPQGEDSHEL